MSASYLKKWFSKPSIAEEVIAVFDSAPGIRKLGHNEEDNYDFLMIRTLCDEFKGELFQRGILFVASDVSQVFEPLGEVERCTVLTAFSAIRGKERVELGKAFGSARDHSDKAMAIAQTAAFKAFLKRSSMTYGQEDDPEKARDSMTPRESVRVAAYQQRAWDAGMRDSGLTPEKVSAELSTLMGFPIDASQIPDLPQKDFDNCMKWLLNHQDLSGQWAKAAEAIIAKRKPQPIVAMIDNPRSDEMTGD